jgi:hypothetical protein
MRPVKSAEGEGEFTLREPEATGEAFEPEVTTAVSGRLTLATGVERAQSIRSNQAPLFGWTPFATCRLHSPTLKGAMNAKSDRYRSLDRGVGLVIL